MAHAYTDLHTPPKKKNMLNFSYIWLDHTVEKVLLCKV